MSESGSELASMTTSELVALWVKSDVPAATNLADAGRRRLVRPRGAGTEEGVEEAMAVAVVGRGMVAPPVRLASVLLGGMRKNEGVRGRKGEKKRKKYFLSCLFSSLHSPHFFSSLSLVLSYSHGSFRNRTQCRHVLGSPRPCLLCSRLQELVPSFHTFALMCYHATEDPSEVVMPTVAVLRKHARHIRQLRLHLSGPYLAMFRTHCTNLKRLDVVIRHMDKTSPDGVLALIRANPRIASMKFGGNLTLMPTLMMRGLSTVSHGVRALRLAELGLTGEVPGAPTRYCSTSQDSGAGHQFPRASKPKLGALA